MRRAARSTPGCADTWQWLLSPWSEHTPGAPVKWDAGQLRSVGESESLPMAAGKRAESEELVITRYAGANLRGEIDKIPNYQNGW